MRQLNSRFLLLAICVLIGTGPVAAQFSATSSTWMAVAESQSSADPADDLAFDEAGFRSKLGHFVNGLDGLPGIPSADVKSVAIALPAVATSDLERLAATTTMLPNWERLPELLHNLERNKEAGRARLIERVQKTGNTFTAASQEVTVEALEEFRSDYAFFVESLRAFAPMMADEQSFNQRVDDIVEQIADIPEEHLDRLRENYYNNAPGWLLAIENKVSASLIPTIPTFNCSFGCPCDFGCPCTEICGFGSCSRICEPFCLAAEATCNLACSGITAICSGVLDLIGEINSAINSINSFLNSFVSTFNTIFNEIAALPSTIENFFVGLWGYISDGLQSAFDSFLGLLPEPEDVLDFIFQPVGGLSAVTDTGFWTDFATGFFQGATLSIDCGTIGLGMGANIPGFGEVGSARAEFVCKRGIDWADEIIWDVIPDDVKGTPAKIPYGLVVHWPIKFFCTCLEAQSSVSFHTAQAEHRTFVAQTLDQEVETVAKQSNLSFLDSDTAALANPGVTTVQSQINQAAAAVADLDGDVVVVDGQVDDINDALDRQGDLVSEIEELTVRIRIEENLLRDKTEAMGIFQSPEAAVEYLSVVRQIVVETIDGTEAINESVYDARLYLQQGDSLLQEGFFEKTYESYQKAYREAVQETP